MLAEALADVPGLRVTTPETNLVYIDVASAGLTASELCGRLRADGILLSAMGKHLARACTHLDVDHAGVMMAVDAIRSAVAAGPVLAAE